MDWTTELPTKPGWYWFYGQQFKSSEVQLHTVVVFRTGEQILRVCGSAIMYESELGQIRHFQPLEPPELPKL